MIAQQVIASIQQYDSLQVPFLSIAVTSNLLWPLSCGRGGGILFLKSVEGS